MNAKEREIHKSAVFERLKHSLQALAIDAEEQVSLFPEFVVKTDELVLDFDNWRRTAVGNYGREMQDEQRQSLAALDEHIDAASPSRGTDRSMWNDDALSSHSFWVTARTLAARALETFGWPVEKPPSYAHEYVRGKRLE